MNLPRRQKQTHRQRTDLWLPRGMGDGWIGSFGLADANYLLYTELINNVLLYRIRNYTQYPVINQNGQEYEYIYIYLNHFAIWQKLTPYYISTILHFFKSILILKCCLLTIPD